MDMFKMVFEAAFPLEGFATFRNGTLVFRGAVNVSFVLFPVKFTFEGFATARIMALIRSSAH